jgi:ArsR family transcriptional regulator, arsenate/arsenite/antimonite-responsive transcriptional repressor
MTHKVEIVLPFPPGLPDDVAATTDSVTPERAAAVFKALADPLRIQLVAMSSSAPDGAICFCDIAAQLDMPQSSLSHHMRVLVDAGILERERRGTWSWYRLREASLQLLQDALRPGGVLLRRSPTRFDEEAGTARDGCREHPRSA